VEGKPITFDHLYDDFYNRTFWQYATGNMDFNEEAAIDKVMAGEPDPRVDFPEKAAEYIQVDQEGPGQTVLDNMYEAMEDPDDVELNADRELDKFLAERHQGYNLQGGDINDLDYREILEREVQRLDKTKAMKDLKKNLKAKSKKLNEEQQWRMVENAVFLANNEEAREFYKATTTRLTQEIKERKQTELTAEKERVRLEKEQQKQIEEENKLLIARDQELQRRGEEVTKLKQAATRKHGASIGLEAYNKTFQPFETFETVAQFKRHVDKIDNKTKLIQPKKDEEGNKLPLTPEEKAHNKRVDEMRDQVAIIKDELDKHKKSMSQLHKSYDEGDNPKELQPLLKAYHKLQTMLYKQKAERILSKRAPPEPIQEDLVVPDEGPVFQPKMDIEVPQPPPPPVPEEQMTEVSDLEEEAKKLESLKETSSEEASGGTVQTFQTEDTMETEKSKRSRADRSDDSGSSGATSKSRMKRLKETIGAAASGAKEGLARVFRTAKGKDIKKTLKDGVTELEPLLQPTTIKQELPDVKNPDKPLTYDEVNKGVKASKSIQEQAVQLEVTKLEDEMLFNAQAVSATSGEIYNRLLKLKTEFDTLKADPDASTRKKNAVQAKKQKAEDDSLQALQDLDELLSKLERYNTERVEIQDAIEQTRKTKALISGMLDDIRSFQIPVITQVSQLQGTQVMETAIDDASSVASDTSRKSKRNRVSELPQETKRVKSVVSNMNDTPLLEVKVKEETGVKVKEETGIKIKRKHDDDEGVTVAPEPVKQQYATLINELPLQDKSAIIQQLSDHPMKGHNDNISLLLAVDLISKTQRNIKQKGLADNLTLDQQKELTGFIKQALKIENRSDEEALVMLFGNGPTTRGENNIRGINKELDDFVSKSLTWLNQQLREYLKTLRGVKVVTVKKEKKTRHKRAKSISSLQSIDSEVMSESSQHGEPLKVKK
jgi:hypothetical protein